MKVGELKQFIYDKVILYKFADDDFTDLYRGEMSDIPAQLLNRDIKVIGAKRKGTVDIEIC